MTIAILQRCRIQDPGRWLRQAQALIDSKEMVEIRKLMISVRHILLNALHMIKLRLRHKPLTLFKFFLIALKRLQASDKGIMKYRGSFSWDY